MEEITSKQRFLAAAAHAGFYFGGLGFIVLPFLIKTVWSGDEFVEGHARQAFYMQIGALIVSVFTVILAFILPPEVATCIGIALLAVAWCFFALVAAVRAMEGKDYVYPALKLVRLY